MTGRSRTGSPVEQPAAPPQNLDAEQAVLGTVLLADTALEQLVDEQLQPEDFYREQHGRIYRAMLDLHRRGEPVDRLTLADQLQHAGALEAVGGLAAIDVLAGPVPVVGNLRQYARIVRDCATLRRLLQVAYRVQSDVHNGGEPQQLVQQAHDALRALDTSVIAEQPVDQVEQFLAWYDSEQKGIPLPFPELTEAVGGGLQPGEGSILGGWPGMGKTLFAKDMLLAASKAGFRCHDYATEQFGPRRTARLVSSLTGLPAGRIRRKELTADDWSRAHRVLEELHEHGRPYRTTPTPGWAAEDYARALLRERWDLAAIDTVTNLSCGKVDEWDRAIGVLFDAAAKAGTHLLLVCQLNLSRDDGKLRPAPVGRDLRNTGAWYQRAKVVLFLHCDQEIVEAGNASIPRTLPEGHVRVDKANDGDDAAGYVEVFRNSRWARFDRLIAKPEDVAA